MHETTASTGVATACTSLGLLCFCFKSDYQCFSKKPQKGHPQLSLETGTNVQLLSAKSTSLNCYLNRPYKTLLYIYSYQLDEGMMYFVSN